jgi:hypothetical protein
VDSKTQRIMGKPESTRPTLAHPFVGIFNRVKNRYTASTQNQILSSYLRYGGNIRIGLILQKCIGPTNKLMDRFTISDPRTIAIETRREKALSKPPRTTVCLPTVLGHGEAIQMFSSIISMIYYAFTRARRRHYGHTLFKARAKRSLPEEAEAPQPVSQGIHKKSLSL